MKNIVITLLLAFATSTCIVTSANAEIDTFARTTASNLNVRSEPNGKDIIGTLPHGSVVAILLTQDVWANIMYLENGNVSEPRKGWVSSQYLKVLYSKDVRDYEKSRTAAL